MDNVSSFVLACDDQEWLARFQAGLKQLADNTSGQLSLWPVEDFLRPRRFIPCTRRGMHKVLTDCWSCWSDVHLGHITLADALRRPGRGD